MSNVALVSHLRLIAQLMSLDGEAYFKVTAFTNAADTIAAMPGDVTTDNFKSIPGVGNSIGQVIKEFLTIGTSLKLTALSQRWPVSALTMTKVHGVGPKTALKLYREGFHNYDELLLAAKSNKLYNAKLRDSVLAAEGKSRVPWETANQLAQYVASQLVPHVERVQVCGSIRRKTPDSKDIDIVCMVKDQQQAQSVLQFFMTLGEPVTSGDKRGSIRASRYGVTMNCDLWLSTLSCWGSFMNHVTGSRDHNVYVRGLAKSKGLLVNEYGIFRGSERLGGEDEHDVYRILEIDYVEPENR